MLKRGKKVIPFRSNVIAQEKQAEIIKKIEESDSEALDKDIAHKLNIHDSLWSALVACKRRGISYKIAARIMKVYEIDTSSLHPDLSDYWGAIQCRNLLHKLMESDIIEKIDVRQRSRLLSVEEKEE